MDNALSHGSRLLRSLSLPVLTLLSDDSGFRRSSVFAEGRGRGKRYPDEPESYQRGIHPQPPCSPSGPSLCHPDYFNLQNMRYSIFLSCPALTTRLRKTHLILRGTRGSAYTPVPSRAVVCGVRARFGGALSRYQVVFPSAPERALIVLLFNLLVILDAGQELFSRT